jgi:hypothetical protein
MNWGCIRFFFLISDFTLFERSEKIKTQQKAISKEAYKNIY